MTDKPRKYCAAFPCRNFAEDGAYCHRHRPAPAPKKADKFYLSVAWRRFRAWYLGKHPLCEQCLRDLRGPVPAQMVDHIIEVKDGGDRLSEDNAMSLCFHCHNVKTAAVQNKRKNHQLPKQNNRQVSRLVS